MPTAPASAISALLILCLLITACGTDDTEAAGTAESSTGSTTADETSTTAENSTTTSTEPEPSDDADGSADPGDVGGDGERGDDGADAGDGSEDDEEPAAPDELLIAGSLRDGDISVESKRFDVPLGSTVRIEFTSDQVEHIHLHGYDLLADVGPDQVGEIQFVADSPGAFEVELEDSGRFLFELLVR